MVEFRSKLDSSKTSALNKSSFKRMLIPILILSAVIIALGVLGIVYGEDDGDFSSGVFLVVVGALFTPFVWIVSVILRKRMDNSSSFIDPNTEEVYAFDDDFVTITQNRGDEYTAYTKAKYNYFYRVREERDYYFLYISKAQCHVIDKSSLTQGSIDEMNSLLRAQLGPKFKQKR